MTDRLGFASGELLYSNPFATERDVADFRLEGQAQLSFPDGRLRMENSLDPELGQQANFVLWCPRDFPDHIRISWEFHPLREPGLCILFFAARGRQGEDLFDPGLAPRAGIYDSYHSGDINALHMSYFRRKHPRERAFCTCNLRKSRGFHLVAQGADPIPTVADALPPYFLTLWKSGPRVAFSIRQADEEIVVVDWTDDATAYGPVLGGGKIGFRQMAPLVGEYANFTVSRIHPG